MRHIRRKKVKMELMEKCDRDIQSSVTKLWEELRYLPAVAAISPIISTLQKLLQFRQAIMPAAQSSHHSWPDSGRAIVIDLTKMSHEGRRETEDSRYIFENQLEFQARLTLESWQKYFTSNNCSIFYSMISLPLPLSLPPSLPALC